MNSYNTIWADGIHQPAWGAYPTNHSIANSAMNLYNPMYKGLIGIGQNFSNMASSAIPFTNPVQSTAQPQMMPSTQGGFSTMYANPATNFGGIPSGQSYVNPASPMIPQAGSPYTPDFSGMAQHTIPNWGPPSAVQQHQLQQQVHNPVTHPSVGMGSKGANNFNWDKFNATGGVDYVNPAALNASQGGWWQSIKDWVGNQNWLGDSTHAGILPTMSGIASAGLSGYLGIQQMKQARDQFDFDKQSYLTNLHNQAQLTNDDLIERQRNRHYNDPDTYAAPDAEWQKKHLMQG